MIQKTNEAIRMKKPLIHRLQDLKINTMKLWTDSRWFQAWTLKKWLIILVTMAFLLGRATILEDLNPFAIAYFAVIYSLRRDLLRWIGAALLVGSLLSVHSHSGYILAEMIVFLAIQKGLERYERADLSFVPIISFVTVFLVQLFSYLVSMELSWYTSMLTVVEAAMSFILTLIFIHAIPIFTLSRKKYTLKNEEIICLIILLASVMTGTINWQIGSITVEHVLSRYLILLFALVGGAPLGASVGVITGLILSLANVNAVYQMSLLAFAGMLGGLMKEGNKLMVALGMLLGSSILSIYIGDQAAVIHSTWESLAAAILFLFTPGSVIRTLARFIPGTPENLKTHYDYARRVRDITAHRVEQFSEVFRMLSRNFRQLSHDAGVVKREDKVDHFMNSVSGNTCTSCWKQKHCWDNNFHKTYAFMTEIITSVETNEQFSARDIPPAWKKVCVKTERVLDVMKQQFALYKHDIYWRNQLLESRQFVADQLHGVSKVMDDLAFQIKREGQELVVQEEQIRHALEELGLSIQGIDVINLEEGNVEIEIVHRYMKGYDECRKIIAPLLTNILGENISVKTEQFSVREEGYYTVTFGSAKEFEVETGIAGAAKGGDLLSGDSFSTMELGNGKFAVALSDGMGNGERARAESSAALSILQQLLQSGMDEQLAIKSVNSVLMLRSTDEMFATVDMALIDLYSAKTMFMKIGSTPSFIRRGDDVLQISANNLPVGILQDIEVDLVSVQLEPGDILIMMTDGLYDAPGYAVNKDLWMKRIIQEIDVESSQDIADCLLERIIRQQHGEIIDDMTVIVSKIERFQPEWATFRWPGLARMERPKTVS